MEPSAQERAFAAEVKRHLAGAQVTQQWVAQQVGLSRPKISTEPWPARRAERWPNSGYENLVVGESIG
ncbi:MAG: hypothetical protein ACRDRA_16055 [Pseudonocardiaceae bacterium]